MRVDYRAGYAGPLSVEWEDGRMDRIHGATESSPAPVLRGRIEGLRTAPRFKARDAAGAVIADEALAAPGTAWR